MEGAGWEGRAGGGRNHLGKRSESLHRVTQPSSSLEKLSGQESVTQDGRALQRGREEVKLTQEWPKGGQTREKLSKTRSINVKTS